MIILIIWTIVLIAVVLLYLRQMYSRFDRYGVKYLKPLPIVGNMGKLLLRITHLVDDLADLYSSFPGERFVGRFEFLNEIVVIRDVDLLKKITVKDFEYFIDRRTKFEEIDTIFARNLFAMRGQEWKDMRCTLSPAFTSSKMRLMVPLMMEVGDQMIKSLKRKLEALKDGYIDIDCKDLTTRYTNDVIALCAFGIKVDSYADENNDFYTNAKKASIFKFRQTILFFLLANCPKVVKIFKLDIFSESSKIFLRSIVLDSMKDRELRNIVRPDMINLLMETKKGKLVEEEKMDEIKADTGFATVEESIIGKRKSINRAWPDEDLIAQGVLFFIAGFEGVSAAMSFLFYDLAMNPEVQERLAQEIIEHDAKNGGKFDFNSIQSMPYLDMVVSESLRLWSPGLGLDRVCVKDYNLGKPNPNSNKDFMIRKGTAVLIPTYGIHRDPYFYPDPMKFDPERFSEQNKHKIHPFAYMPFGIGPRNCIGSRFALCEMKVIAYQILKQMELSACEKTTAAPQLSTESFNIELKGGHWLRFRARK